MSDTKFEHKPGNGAVFINGKKEKDTHADFNGTANIGGTIYYVNMWEKKTRKGDVYYNFSFKEKTEKSDE